MFTLLLLYALLRSAKMQDEECEKLRKEQSQCKTTS